MGYELQADDLALLRSRLYLDDSWTPAVAADPDATPPIVAAPAAGASSWNQIHQKEFFSDDDLQALCDQCENEFGSGLDQLRLDTYNLDIQNGMSVDDSNADADATRLFTLLKLIRALGAERFIADPGWVTAWSANTPPGSQIMAMKNLQSQIDHDRLQARGRLNFVSVPIERY
jgi:hypothetical protein